MTMIRVVLPYHLRNLARVNGEVELEVAGPVTLGAVLDALETRYPVLCGTIRDHETLKRRPFVSCSPAKRMCPSNRRRRDCRTPSPTAKSRSWSSAPWPEAE